MAETYAIVESGGKQYRAEKGSVLVVDRLPADEGAKVALRPVMFRGDKDVVLDGGDLEKVKVEATVAEHLRGEKLRVFKYKPKKGYRRRAGHRSELTRLEVTEVKMAARKPAAKAEPEAKAKAEKPPAKAPAKGKGKAETKAKPKAPAKPKPKPSKPAAKKAAGKAGAKQASGKAATKKPTTRKTSAKKKE